MEEISEHAKNLTLSEDLEKTLEERVNMFYNFVKFCHNNKKAQKYLLGGFECLVKLYQIQLLPRVPIILKDLYDADMLEEDVILAWAEKRMSWFVKKEKEKKNRSCVLGAKEVRLPRSWQRRSTPLQG
ncbi:eukaryotic translation initiation factor 5 [Alosa pseudoharengus]|uniref:eukaryotic translation initiation factor 5 n=1 Tax=Alosa pseudoharengus TaxID=34774 RepID=UPI003F8AC8AA